MDIGSSTEGRSALGSSFTILAERSLTVPCKPGPMPRAGGFSGLLQNLAIVGLDSVACCEGITRGQPVVNLIGYG
jgi:hypothetical protein